MATSLKTKTIASSRGRTRTGDRVFYFIVLIAAIAVVAIVGLLVAELFYGSRESIAHSGFSFLTGSTWDPVHNIFASLPFIYGTLVTSALALLLGVPISLGVAIFLSEMLKERRRLGDFLGSLVELLAAVPSVVYGLWGLVILSPVIRDYVEKPLNRYLGAVPVFAGSPFGLDFFTAGVILAIMIIPTVSSISREVLRAVPVSQREAALSLGATDWETVSHSVIPYARSGLFGAIILGLGRAVGETMAVTMVIGNSVRISPSLFSPGYTLSSVIANEFTEATSSLYVSSLVEIGLVLFFVALVINIFARFLIWRITKFTRTKV